MVTKKDFVIKRGMGEKTIAKSGWAPVTGIGMDSQHGKGMGMKLTATSEKSNHYLKDILRQKNSFIPKKGEIISFLNFRRVSHNLISI
jgi:hypothetical protein